MRYQSLPRLSLKDYTRFESKIHYEPMSGCWLWGASVGKNGYGMFSYQNIMGLVHRISYTMERGPIPEGLSLDHLCRVRCCVNPQHLEPVTSLENNRRGKLLYTHCPSGHEYSPENLYCTKEGWRQCRACRKARQVARDAAAKKWCVHPNLLKTHCPKGHPYTGSNLYVYNNERFCKTCTIDRVNAKRRSAKAKL